MGGGRREREVVCFIFCVRIYVLSFDKMEAQNFISLNLSSTI